MFKKFLTAIITIIVFFTQLVGCDKVENDNLTLNNEVLNYYEITNDVFINVNGKYKIIKDDSEIIIKWENTQSNSFTTLVNNLKICGYTQENSLSYLYNVTQTNATLNLTINKNQKLIGLNLEYASENFIKSGVDFQKDTLILSLFNYQSTPKVETYQGFKKISVMPNFNYEYSSAITQRFSSGFLCVKADIKYNNEDDISSYKQDVILSGFEEVTDGKYLLKQGDFDYVLNVYKNIDNSLHILLYKCKIDKSFYLTLNEYFQEITGILEVFPFEILERSFVFYKTDCVGGRNVTAITIYVYSYTDTLHLNFFNSLKNNGYINSSSIYYKTLNNGKIVVEHDGLIVSETTSFNVYYVNN